MQNFSQQSGYIALTSAIIIVFVLITITVILSFSGFLGRFNILYGEFKEKSSGLAEACMQIAIVNLAQKIENVGGFTVGDGQCFIDSISISGSNKIVRTHAIYNNSYTNLKAEVAGATFSIISFEECADPC